jgi:hypothetical protein
MFDLSEQDEKGADGKTQLWYTTTMTAGFEISLVPTILHLQMLA